MTDNSKICVAKILTAHGVRGLIKLDCFLEDPKTLESYNPLTSKDGKAFTIRLKNSLKGQFLAEIEGVSDRTEAEKYRHIELFIDRDKLPDLDEGHYIDDLVGLDVQDNNGQKIGKIISVENFGAGDLVQIEPVNGKRFYLPFNEPYVIEITDDYIRTDPIEDFLE